MRAITMWEAVRQAAAIAMVVAAVVVATARDAGADSGRVTVGTQFGLAYLPLVIMEHDRLWEKHADVRGVKLAVTYARLGGGGALNDALISDSVDLVAGGVAPMLVLWDRTATSFKVKGLAALNASPMYVLANKPGLKSLADFKFEDRIAVPAIRVSIQALALMAAAERTFGPGQFNRLDNLTVAMQHPDALAMLTAPGRQISGYVSSSPFQEIALKRPGIIKITDSFAAFGGPSTFSVLYAKEAFVTKNPAIVDAFYAALAEAFQAVASDRAGAIDKYLEVTQERTDHALIEEILARPDFTFGTQPKGTLRIAEIMQRAGLLKQKPASWMDYFVEPLHAGQGS